MSLLRCVGHFQVQVSSRCPPSYKRFRWQGRADGPQVFTACTWSLASVAEDLDFQPVVLTCCFLEVLSLAKRAWEPLLSRRESGSRSSPMTRKAQVIFIRTAIFCIGCDQQHPHISLFLLLRLRKRERSSSFTHSPYSCKQGRVREINAHRAKQNLQGAMREMKGMCHGHEKESDIWLRRSDGFWEVTLEMGLKAFPETLREPWWRKVVQGRMAGAEATSWGILRHVCK